MKKLIFILLLIVFIFSCKTQLIEQEKTYVPEVDNLSNVISSATNKSVYYFIRHSEEKKDSNDPSLSDEGILHARMYLRFFKNKKIDTIYTTNIKRTIETSKIIANSKIPIVYYNPSKKDYNCISKSCKNSTCLIVGHSNTTPEIANTILGRPKYSQMVDDNYSDIIKVVVVGKTKVGNVLVIEDEIQKIEDSKLSPQELRRVLRKRKKKAKLKENK